MPILYSNIAIRITSFDNGMHVMSWNGCDDEVGEDSDGED